MKVIPDSTIHELLRGWGIQKPDSITRVDGGFSDAIVWRIVAAPDVMAFKAYTQSKLGPGSLDPIHKQLSKARDCGITALPRVLSHPSGASWLHYRDDVCFDLVTWQPGEPLLFREPTPARLAATGPLLARLHLASAGH